MANQDKKTDELFEECFELLGKGNKKPRTVKVNPDGELVIMLNPDDPEDVAFHEEWQQENEMDLNGASLLDPPGPHDIVWSEKREKYDT